MKTISKDTLSGVQMVLDRAIREQRWDAIKAVALGFRLASERGYAEPERAIKGALNQAKAILA